MSASPMREKRPRDGQDQLEPSDTANNNSTPPPTAGGNGSAPVDTTGGGGGDGYVPIANLNAQKIEHKSDTDKVVRNSPYGGERNTKFGWGSPFVKPINCYLEKLAPQVFIGLSSLNGVPAKQKDRDMDKLMSQYLKKFNILEHCATYHRMNDRIHWERWHNLPGPKRDSFLYTVKANKYLTHDRQMEADGESLEHVENFFVDRCAALKGRMGAVLVQLPPQFRRSATNMDRLRSIAAAIPNNLTICVEFRNKTWWNDETYALLRTLNWSLVVTHNEDIGESPFVDTGSNVLYVRLHGAVSQYLGDYGPVEMQRWAQLIYNFVSKDPVNRKVFFFLNNNESHVANVTSSVVDASCLTMKLKALLEARGGFEGSRKKMPSKKHQIPVLSQKAEDSLVASAVAKQKILKGIKSAKIAPVAVRKVGRPAKVILERSEPWLQVAVSLKAKRGPKAKKVGKK